MQHCTTSGFLQDATLHYLRVPPRCNTALPPGSSKMHHCTTPGFLQDAPLHYLQVPPCLEDSSAAVGGPTFCNVIVVVPEPSFKTSQQCRLRAPSSSVPPQLLPKAGRRQRRPCRQCGLLPLNPRLPNTVTDGAAVFRNKSSPHRGIVYPSPYLYLTSSCVG
jgi:hypothetical protein